MRAVAVGILLAPVVILTAFVAGFGVATTAPQSTPSPATSVAAAPGSPYTVATFNILGASHTDGEPGQGLGGGENEGWPSWRTRLPRALERLADAGVSIAGLQEVHAPQSRALDTTYRDRWGMYPHDPGVADKVIWDPTRWRLSERQLVKVPYLHGQLVDTPLVRLTAIDSGQVVWVWSVHNPIGARRHRDDALQLELRTVTELAASGKPVVLVGDFNDSHDGPHRSEAMLTPWLIEARPRGSSLDHLYGAHLVWHAVLVDRSPDARRISDHPLAIGTWSAARARTMQPPNTRTFTIAGTRWCLPSEDEHRVRATDPNHRSAGLCSAGGPPSGRIGADGGNPDWRPRDVRTRQGRPDP